MRDEFVDGVSEIETSARSRNVFGAFLELGFNRGVVEELSDFGVDDLSPFRTIGVK